MSGRGPCSGLLLGLLLAGGISTPYLLADSPEPPDLAKARLGAARKTYEAHVEALPKGRADAEKVYLWSVRWLEAQRAVSKRKADRLAALGAHLERMKDLRKLVTARYRAGSAPQADALGAEFYVAEAQFWLAEAKGR